METKSFDAICKEYSLDEEEKNTAKQIVTLLNGKNQIHANNILAFCKIVIEGSSVISVDFEE